MIACYLESREEGEVKHINPYPLEQVGSLIQRSKVPKRGYYYRVVICTCIRMTYLYMHVQVE